MSANPVRWLKWSPLALVPFLGAWWFGSPSLEQQLQDSALAATKSGGLDWARIEISGRDVTLSGEAPDEAAISAAVQTTIGTYGIRRAVSEATVAPPPPPPPPPPPEPEPLAAPTVLSVITNKAQPEIRGTWPEKDAKTLKVTIAERAFNLGENQELTSDGAGNWKLVPAAPMADGQYDINIEVSDGAGRTAASESPGKLTVDTVAPPEPTVNAVIVQASPDRLTGTWPEGDAVSLKLALGGQTYELGKSDRLTSDGKGNWTLTLPQRLPEGRHDLSIDIADAAGNTVSKAFTAAVDVDAKAPASPTVTPFRGTKMPEKLTGTWAEGDAVSLTVMFGADAHALGTSSALSSDGKGNWSLALSSPLGPGKYDVTVETADRAGNISRITSPGAVDISTPLAVPTVNPAAGNDPQPLLDGTFDSERTKKLGVTIGPKTYELGRDSALAAIELGHWQLKLEKMPDGTYDVEVAATDEFGNTVKDATSGELVIDTTPPAVPTIDKKLSNSRTPRIGGTWAEGDATDLNVTIGGKTHTSSSTPALTIDNGGRWSLAPEPLADGYYDVVAVSADRFGNQSRDASLAEIVIDTTPPAAPVIDPYAGNDSTPEITGTWPASDASSLTLSIGGHTYMQGTDLALTAAKDGTWRLAIAEPLRDGYYDVVATTQDAAGNQSRDSSVAEVVIDLTPPAAPTVNVGTALPITGTFAPGDTKNFTATLAGKTYELGKSPELTAKDGTWSLAPAIEFGPGVYDVAVTAIDEFGNRATDASTAEFYIAEKTVPTTTTPEPTAPPPPPSPPPPPPAPPEPTVEMTVPTVESQIVTVSRPKLTGTWAEGIAKSLKVSVDSRDYLLGQSESLVSDGAGHWTLSLDRPLRDGIYDIAVETVDPAGVAKNDRSQDELIVDAAPPATPTVRLSATELSPGSISGTWAEGDAISLSVGIEGATAVLSTDRALRSDGSGNWTLTLDRTLDPGSYDVVVTTKDGRGRISSDQTKFEILVKGVDEAKPVPETAPIDCQSEFNTLLTVEGIRFGSDDARLDDASQATVAKLAAIAAHCLDKTIEIGGHTDSTGSAEYNLALSEHRAVAVRDAMIAAGVDGERLIAKGYGESSPLANNGTEQGRMVNRRIEFKILN
ncbi:MAG: Ig-like domain-containing protein [Hyphomicrobiales bacterium]